MENPDLRLAEEARRRLYRIRGHEVLLDADASLLYGIDGRNLQELLDRLLEDLPDGLIFQLSPTEAEDLRLKSGRLLPCALTERGVAMLAGLLRSEKALKVSLALLYAFSRSGQAQERRFLTQDDLASSVTAVASSSAERSSSARALAPCGPQA